MLDEGKALHVVVVSHDEDLPPDAEGGRARMDGEPTCSRCTWTR